MLREWLREAEVRAIQRAREDGASLSRIGGALITDRQNIHAKLKKASNTRGLTASEYDGIDSSTLRFWLEWWLRPERTSKGTEEAGRDPQGEAAKVRAELEARYEAGLLRKPV